MLTGGIDMAYIEREKVISELKNLPEQERIEYMGIYDCIKSVPVADVVEVVRCKDCKHLMFSDMYGECSQAHMGIVRPDDFCSYGERKDEE